MKPAMLALVLGFLIASSEIPNPASPCTRPRPHPAAGFVCLG
jgi:hypothetical protein